MFILGTDYLLVVTESLHDWCSRYKLQPSKNNCVHCGTEIETTIPAFGKGWRGLVAPQCTCGNTVNFKKVVLTESTEEACLVSVLV